MEDTYRDQGLKGLIAKKGREREDKEQKNQKELGLLTCLL